MADALELSAVISAQYSQFTDAMAQLGAAAQSGMDQVTNVLSAGAQRSDEAMRQAAESTRNWGEALEEFATSAAGVAAGLGLVELAERAGEAFREAIIGTAEWAEQLKNMAASIGTTTTELQLLQGAGQLAGVNLQGLGQFALQIQRRLAEGGQGAKAFTAALAELGVAPGDFNDLNTGLLKISEGIRRLGGDTPQVRDALAQLGSRGSSGMLPLIANLGELEDRYRNLGGVISEQGVDSAGKFADALNTLKVTAETDARLIGVAFAPVGEVIANSLTTGLMVGVGAFEELNAAASLALRSIVDSAETVGKVMLDALTGHWGAIGSDWRAGTASLASDEHTQFERMKTDALDAVRSIKTAWSEAPATPKVVQGPTPSPLTGSSGHGAKVRDQRGQELAQFSEMERARAEIAGNTAQQIMAADQAIYDKAVQLYSQQSLQATEAYARMAEAARHASTEKIAAAQKELTAEQRKLSQLKSLDQQQLSDIASNQIAILNSHKQELTAELAAHQITKAQELAGERQIVTQIAAVHEQLYQKLAQLYAGDAKEQEKYQQLEIANQLKLQSQTQAIANQSAQQYAATWQRVTGLVSGQFNQMFGQLIAGHLNLQATAQQVFGSTMQSLLDMLIQKMIQLIGQTTLMQSAWAILQGVLGSGSSVGNMAAQKQQAAQLALANGVASFAAAPWPLDMGAPAFGAAMMAAASSFAGGGLVDVPSAAGGMVVPSTGGKGPGVLSVLHQNEMVLPAPLSARVQKAFPTHSEMAPDDASGPPRGFNSGGGDVHHHNWGGVHLNVQGDGDILSQVAEHKEAIAGHIWDAVERMGAVRYRGR